MAYRTCSLAECERKHVARGFCSTHYNVHVTGEERRHPKVDVPCVVCRTVVRRRADKAYLPTCSVACRTQVQFGRAAAKAYDWRSDVVSRVAKYGCRMVEQFDREEIFERDDWTCRECSIRCTEPNPYVLTSATVDHVVALSLGGEHSRANVQTLCLSCNARKRDKAAA